MIFNRGKPRHARPRRPWATMLATLLTTIALVFVPGTALADSGMDVSKWQGCVGSSQAATAKASGVNFAFVKVTEGNGYTDSVADCTMQSLKANGIRRGVYHFARPDLGNSPEAEADWFIGQTRGYVNDGVIPVLDWEPSGSYVTWSWWALRWLQRVESAWGVKPLIYTSASVIKMTDWTAVANANYGLGLPDIRVDIPERPCATPEPCPTTSALGHSPPPGSIPARVTCLASVPGSTSTGSMAMPEHGRSTRVLSPAPPSTRPRPARHPSKVRRSVTHSPWQPQ